MRDLIRANPWLYALARRIKHALGFGRTLTFLKSGQYWEDRYRLGGNSGDGSYDRLAEFKAEFLNAFVATHGIASVMEFGVGDGNQLALAAYPSFVGVDVANTAIQQCRTRFAGDPAKAFFTTVEFEAHPVTAELSLSLDVIYHLVEDAVFDTYMRRLFASASRYVIVYASNFDAGADAPHVRHRQFTPWVAGNAKQWRLASHTPNRYPPDANDPANTSFADFFVFERLH